MEYIVLYTIDHCMTYTPFATEDEAVEFITNYKAKNEGDYDGDKIIDVIHGEFLDIKPVEVVTKYKLERMER